MRHLTLAFVVALIPAGVSAQVVELGGTIAAGCVGSDGSLCSSEHPMYAAHASWWLADRVEIAGRVAHMRLTPYRGITVFPHEVTFDVTGRSRDFFSALFIYHFRRGNRVRPFVGFGSGAYGHAQRVDCSPLRCASVPGLPPEGHRREWMRDAILTTGASIHVTKRWNVRAGFLSHRFGNDENSTTEWLVGAGYRFGVQ